MTIGFFDSGIGGITVLENAMVQLPQENFIFYADVDHVPYGVKSEREIREYLDSIVEFMISKKVDILVLACNTATSAAADYLREKYDIPILGMEPAVKVARSELDPNYHDLIIVSATELTLKLEKLDDLIHRLGINDNIMALSLQKLVEFAEKGKFNDKEVLLYLDEMLSQINFNRVCAFVLGCTHFTYYKSMIKKYLKLHAKREIPVIDGNQGTVKNLIRKIQKSKTNNSSNSSQQLVRFFESGREVDSNKYIKLLKLAHEENSGRV